MKKIKLFFAIIACILALVACKYDFIIPAEIPSVDDPDAPAVSFSQQVLPIFTSNNNCIACHKSGGTSPDLTAANAYNSINNSKYINTTNPAESKIYSVVAPSTSGHTHKKYTASEAAIVLAWITQGARNN